MRVPGPVIGAFGQTAIDSNQVTVDSSEGSGGVEWGGSDKGQVLSLATPLPNLASYAPQQVS